MPQRAGPSLRGSGARVDFSGAMYAGPRIERLHGIASCGDGRYLLGAVNTCCSHSQPAHHKHRHSGIDDGVAVAVLRFRVVPVMSVTMGVRVKPAADRIVAHPGRSCHGDISPTRFARMGSQLVSGLAATRHHSGTYHTSRNLACAQRRSLHTAIAPAPRNNRVDDISAGIADVVAGLNDERRIAVTNAENRLAASDTQAYDRGKHMRRPGLHTGSVACKMFSMVFMLVVTHIKRTIRCYLFEQKYVAVSLFYCNLVAIIRYACNSR